MLSLGRILISDLVVANLLMYPGMIILYLAAPIFILKMFLHEYIYTLLKHCHSMAVLLSTDVCLLHHCCLWVFATACMFCCMCDSWLLLHVWWLLHAWCMIAVPWLFATCVISAAIGDFRGAEGVQVPPVEKWVVENLKETLKYILVLLNQVFLTL